MITEGYTTCYSEFERLLVVHTIVFRPPQPNLVPQMAFTVVCGIFPQCYLIYILFLYQMLIV